MGLIAVTLFSGLVAVGLISQIHYAEDVCHLIGFVECVDGQPVAGSPPQLSLIAQIAAATFGDGTVLFFIIQAATAAVLLLAANTAFNGFPLLGSVLARDGYAPKSLATRGDRLIYSNGVLALSAVAALILVVYQANVTALIQLYIIGVFTSFTLGQTGMIRHWRRLLRQGATDRGRDLAQPDDQRGRRGHDRERAHHRDGHEVHPRRLAGLRRHARADHRS